MRAAHMRNIEQSAKRRDLRLFVSIEFLWELYEQQERQCALSGLPIAFGRVHYPHETTASLDRIDSNLEYTPQNVQWVHKAINRLKHKLEQGYFIALCKAVAAHRVDGNEPLMAQGAV